MSWSMNSSSFSHSRGHIAIGHFLGTLYHRFGIIAEGDVISSRESTNTLKPVGVGLDEVFVGVEWRSEVMPDHSMFCCRFSGWAGWVMFAGEFDHTVQLDNSQL